MPLLNPDEPEDSKAYLDEASAYFLKAIKQHYTRDTAVDVMEVLTPILGKDWKGRLIFGIMAEKYRTIRNFSILRSVDQSDVKKINAIKSVRYITGLGLTEAKSFVEEAYFVTKQFNVRGCPEDLRPDEWDKAVNESFSNLRFAGFKVEFI